MAREWARVPSYAEALERALGPAALAGVLGGLAEKAPELRALGRGMFERWLDRT